MPATGQTLMYRDLVAETFRHLVGLVVWGIGLVCALVIEILAIQAHYLSTSSALELLGEQKPLGLDPLIGSYLGSFLDQASQNHFRALMIVAVIALGCLIIAQQVSGLLTLLEQRAALGQAIAALDPAARAASELTQARRAANARLLVLLIWLGVFGGLVGTAAYWDLTLNWYQQIASISGIDLPVEAGATIQTPDREMKEYGHLMAWHLAGFGAYGFLAIMVLGAVFLEYSAHRLSDRWGRLCNVVAELCRFNSADDPGAQTFAPAQPAAGGTSGQTQDLGGEPLFDAAAPEGPAAQAAAPEPPPDIPVEVIGGAPGERVTVAEALRNPARYWVDRDTQQVWNRAYHDNLTATGD